MAQITHLPANCSIQDIIEVIEEQGAAIVDDFCQSVMAGKIQYIYRTAY